MLFDFVSLPFVFDSLTELLHNSPDHARRGAEGEVIL